MINCYETDEEIVIDFIGYDSPDIMYSLYLNDLKSGKFNPNDKPQARRYILPIVENINDVEKGVNLLKNKFLESKAVRIGDKVQVSYHALAKSPHEQPAINRNYFSSNYKYYYASGFFFNSEYDFSVIKVNVESGEVVKWFAGDGNVPSEPTFIEKPNCTAEDDGILLVCITSTLSSNSDRLVVLDAKSMKLIGTASVQSHIPLVRRGIFID